jgi:hypothetical protein
MKILTILMLVLIIPFISAIYAGETIVVENTLHTENIIWTITNNSTKIFLPEITYDLSNITIHFKEEMPPQSYTIVFLEETTKTVIQEVKVSGGGGGHSTRYVDRNFTSNITQYVDREVIKDKEVIKEVPKEIIKNKIPLWFWIAWGLLGAALIIIFIKSLMNSNQTNERGIRNA